MRVDTLLVVHSPPFVILAPAGRAEFALLVLGRQPVLVHVRSAQITSSARLRALHLLRARLVQQLVAVVQEPWSAKQDARHHWAHAQGL